MRGDSILKEVPQMSYHERRSCGLQARFTFSTPKDTPPVVVFKEGELEELPLVSARSTTDEADYGDQMRVEID